MRARFGAATVRAILAAATGRDTYYNVNFPYCAPDAVTGIEAVTHQRFSRSPFRYYPSDNDGKFFVAIPETPAAASPERRFRGSAQDRAITVTPLALQQTDMLTLERIKGRLTL